MLENDLNTKTFLFKFFLMTLLLQEGFAPPEDDDNIEQGEQEEY